MKNYLTLIEISVFVLIVILDAVGILPITQTIYLIPFIWLMLRNRKEKFRDLGLKLGPMPLWQSAIIGISLGVLLELFATFITTPIISTYFGSEPNLTELQSIQGNISMLIIFIVLSWVIAAFGEEICFRGFLMKQIAILLGQSNAAWVLSVVLSSVLFGWGHSEQGVTGWMQEGLSGLFLGITFLLSGKNLTIPIITHGISNTLAFILIYLGQYPGIY